MKVKDAASSAAKFVARAGQAAPAYTAGVQGAGQTWATNTAASETNYGLGVQEAITSGRFGKGVVKAGAAKYTAGASGKGARNYPAGVAAAGPAWQAGVQPYLTVLSNLTLPPKGPTGSANNIQRVQIVATALRTAKIGS